jgi:hypothetical protein
MKRHIATAAAFAVLAIAAGCSHSASPKVASAAGGSQPHPSSTASPGPSPAADAADRQIQFQQCMHDHGVEVEVGPDGKLDIAPSQGSIGKPTAQIEACQAYLPNGGTKSRAPVTPEDIEILRHLSQCIREHGFPDWPDPDPETGAMNLNSMPNQGRDIKSNPQFRQAAQACQGIMASAYPSANIGGGGDGGKK